jgi:mRNA-degrading endonuclease toxin of MazEF toxin-antitoxin module
VIWQSDTLTSVLQSILVVPLTSNLDRANLAETALVTSSSAGGPPQDSVALAFQMRAIPKSALQAKIRDLDENELEELELATDEALGRVEPKSS